MRRNRAAHLVELAHVFAGTPVASDRAKRGAETRKARAAQLRLPCTDKSPPGAAEVEIQRAELRCVLLDVLRGMGEEPRYVSVGDLAAWGLPALLALEEVLAALPGGPNPLVLMKLRLAKQRLAANHSAEDHLRERGRHAHE